MATLLVNAAVAALLLSPAATPVSRHAAHQDEAPRILLDQSPKAIEYQLNRLTNDQLLKVERKDTDVKYRLVYVAILTRKGMARPAREEALTALAKLDRATPVAILMDALGKVPAGDAQNAGALLDVLLAQPQDALRQQREALLKAAADAAAPAVLQGAYGGLMIADGAPGPAWQAATAHSGHLVELLKSIPHLGKADDLRAKLFEPVGALLNDKTDAATRAAAVLAVPWTRRDSAAFDLLAREILQGTQPDVRAAAVQSLQVIPEPAWTAANVEPLTAAIVGIIKETPPDKRMEPPATEALQLGDKLAAALPEDKRRTARRDLRALGVQVVRIQSVPEQLVFDLKWFAVEAGKPVQIVLVNPDAMQHNLVVGQPGSVQELGTKGAMVPLPTDPEAKPYVPDSPLVLFATRLLNGGETERLNFTAPSKPGEYVFLCTFPGHWIRMYGVMLVVENLDAWEAKPTVPTDPVTNKPYTSQRN